MRFRSMLLTSTAMLALGAAPVAAGPDGPAVVGGAAAVTGAGTSQVTINQSSQRAIINWTTFNIGAGETTTFVQPGSSSVALNRVTGGLGPSQIYGTLTANGQVFVINRDGVLVGPTGVINTAGFLASTNDINNADFMAGRYNFTQPGRPDASIVNQGHITAASGGFAALVAPGVRNSGTITATLGTVALASGNTFTLDLYGDKLIQLSPSDAITDKVIDVATGKPLSALVTNEGKVSASGGRVELTAAAARAVVDSVINTTGVIEADTVGTRDGKIVLGAATAESKPTGAPTQTVKVSGTLSAAGKDKGNKGGTVIVTGEDIHVTGAKVDVSGHSGGGKVMLGGDWAGGHPALGLVSNQSATLETYQIATATTLSVDATTTIDASARSEGHGGKVILWSDGQTTFAGTIFARGGDALGNGGFVEVSGKQGLAFSGQVDTRAPSGLAGTLLLDPDNYLIDAIAAATIAGNLGTTGVIISTSAGGSGGLGDIFVNAPVAWSGSNSLTLSAFRDIAVNANLTNTGGAAVTLRADNTGTGIGTVSFGRNAQVSTAGAVSIFYNPAHYGLPTPFDDHVTGGATLTAYMLVNTFEALQKVNTNLSGTYALGRDINGGNMLPIGSASAPFTGVLEGQGHSISNAIIAPAGNTEKSIGLFAAIGPGGVVRNLNLTDFDVSGNRKQPKAGQFVGLLAGTNAGTIINVHAAGTINGTPVDQGKIINLTGVVAGGLVGQNGMFGHDGKPLAGTIINSSANVIVSVGDGSAQSCPGCAPGTNVAGGLVGTNVAGSTIAGSQASGATTGRMHSFVGGLVGRNEASIAGSSASGAVASTKSGQFSSAVGGLVGVNTGSISDSHASGNASGDGSSSLAIVGGLVGLNNKGGQIANSYATGTVTGTSGVELGGLVGGNFATITDSYATGAVNGSGSGTTGGLVGMNVGTIAGSHATGPVTLTLSGQSDGIAGGLVGENLGQITASHATGAVSSSGGDVFGLGGLVGSNEGSISGSHATGAVTATGATFAYVGGFIGANAGTITNSHATGNVSSAGVPVKGPDGQPFFIGHSVGGLVGYNIGSITGSHATGSLTGGANAEVGGLVGTNTAGIINLEQTIIGTISSSYATGPVTGGQGALVGGLVGLNQAAIESSHATGNVTGGLDSAVGGLVGRTFSTIGSQSSITNSYAEGNVSSAGGVSAAGGLIGFNSGNVTLSHATGSVSMGPGSFGLAGGFAGGNDGNITLSYATGTATAGDNGVAGGFAGANLGSINQAYTTGPVTAGNNSVVGGFVGINAALSSEGTALPGSITQAYALGPATGGNAAVAAAFAALNLGTLDQVYAAGLVSVGAGSKTGGLVALNGGTLPSIFGQGTSPSQGTATSSYWDRQTTGQVTSAGGVALDTAVLTGVLPSGFGTTVWANGSYPYLVNLGPQDTTPGAPVLPPLNQLVTAPTQQLALLNQNPPAPPPDLLNLQGLTQSLQQQQVQSQQVPGGPINNPIRLNVGEGRYFYLPPPEETRLVRNEVVIQLPCDAPQQTLDAALGQLELSALGSQCLGNNVAVYRLRIGAGRSIADVIRGLASHRIVAAAQANYLYRLTQDPAALPQQPQGDSGQYVIEKLKLTDIHRRLRASSIPVAVIDSEIDAAHPDLEGAVVDRYDATGVDEPPHSHGTGMAGAIASHRRLLGTAPGARLFAIRAFSVTATAAESTTFSILKGLDYAVNNGVRIVNMSFAGPRDPTIERALKAAHDRGIIMIAAAGNAGPRSPPLFPAADKHVIAVTATDIDDNLFTGATRGKHIAVSAPGVDILVPAPAAAYQLTTGTSVATAHVSGIVALMLERNPSLTPADVRRILTASAKRLGPDDHFGAGLIDPVKALQLAAPRSVEAPARR